MSSVRIEKDYLGKREIRSSAYYGVQSDRARENFAVSGLRLPLLFIMSYALIKRAAAETNRDLLLLDRRKASAIIRACEELMAGRFQEEMIVDVFQAGAGTSQNMNVNEVIANRAIEILGGKKGDYSIIHPNDHVNMSQSTNDTFPTCMRISLLLSAPLLLRELEGLIRSLGRKAKEFRDVVKSARTHLQDAVPITLGQEFQAYAAALSSATKNLKSACRRLQRIPIGGTAAGTGLNAPPEYRKRVVRELRRRSGLKLSSGKDLIELLQSAADFAFYSSALKNLALELIRISNDLRLLSSGPNTGFAEITLPAVQPGSSIMPGKVNPVICEAMDMICFQVVGNDAAVALAAQAGQLDLNVMTPVIIHNILSSMEILTKGLRMFRTKCVNGIQANRERCRVYFETSYGLATALTPLIGYARASELVRASLKSGKDLMEVLKNKEEITNGEIRKIFPAGPAASAGIEKRARLSRRRRNM